MTERAELIVALADMARDGVLEALNRRLAGKRPTRAQYRAALLRVRATEPDLVRTVLEAWQLPAAAAQDRRVDALVFMVAAIADLLGEQRNELLALARPTVERWASAHDPLWKRWTGELAC
ncbi:MAG: hypothetical protein NZ761_12715 [Dehalococcoidia bacterium]|nr:hypothetical protein [Dehalococcoidia bacterium]